MKIKTLITLSLAVTASVLVVSVFSIAHLPAPEPTTETSNTNLENNSNDIKTSDMNFASSIELPNKPTFTDRQKALAQDGSKLTSDQDKIVTIQGKTYPLRTYNALSIPNDPQANQWWVQNIDLDEAWDIPEGDNPTTLAIIDTGFALAHEEFEDRWHENAGEKGATDEEAASDLNCTDQSLPLTRACNNIDDDSDGATDNESGATTIENVSFLNCSDQSLPLDKSCNRIDDDENGYIDDVTGWDFINGDSSVQAGETNPDDPDASHGSYVAGVAAAKRNNGVGLAGVNAGATILPVQALDDTGSGHTLSVARAVYYAVEQGADVISLSLGSSESDEYLQQAILDAIANGSIVVAASGNDGCNCISYPARYEEVVSVGASNSSNNPYSFSNYGANLDVLAPGAGFHTVHWSAGNQTSSYASNIAGTSLATPVVSGLLTTMRSHSPNASATELVAALTENTDRTGISTEHVEYRGFGRIKAHASVQRLLSSYTPPLTYEFSPVSSGETLSIETTADNHQVRVYACGVYGEFGTTPLYHVTPAVGSSYITSSYAERAAALDDGASAQFLTRVCVMQPHDISTTERIINPLIEFKNIL